VAADAGHYGQATRLWGAAEQSCRALGIVPNPLRVRLRKEFERAAIDALGEYAGTREFDRGRSDSLSDALQLGLQAIESAGATWMGASGRSPSFPAGRATFAH